MLLQALAVFAVGSTLEGCCDFLPIYDSMDRRDET